jgi:beta-lactam-binding protein with PASTA domain
MKLISKIKNFVLSKAFAWNIGAIVLVYVILFFSVKSCMNTQTNHGQKIEVPQLKGQNQNNLDNLLANTGLKYEVLDSIWDPKKVEGTVLEQDPMPTNLTNVHVKEGRVIKVRVSKRSQLTEMPELVSKSLRLAEAKLQNRDLKYKLELKPSKESDGAVIEQLYRGKPIAAGKRLPKGSTITLVVGQKTVGEPKPLPNLNGLTIEEARMRLKVVGDFEFIPVCQDCQTASDSLVARVISQNPAFSEGALIMTGSTVTVIASKAFAPAPR